MNERHRVDLWLKLVCLLKHRAEATAQCRGGHVRINGERVKPAAMVREGDVIEFLQGEHPRRVLVLALPEVQASREAARGMYVDQTPRRVEPPPGAFRPRGSGRPTKRQRRQIDRLKR